MKKSALSSAPVLALSLAIGVMCFPTKASADGSHKPFDVKNYGATGNGTTDDTAAIKAAITAAGAGTGNVVSFPTGTYLYSGQLTANGITFQGETATLLSASSSAFVVAEGTNTNIFGLSFSGLSSGLNHALFGVTATNLVVSGNTFSSSFISPLLVQSSSQGTISGNKFNLANSGFGVFITNSGSYTIASNTFNLGSSTTDAVGVVDSNPNGPIAITSNTFNGSTASSNNSTAIASFRCPDAQVFLNTINGWALGIASRQDTIVTVNSNKVNNSGAAAILLAGSGSANATSNVIDTAAGHGIVVTGNIGTVNLVESTISNTGRAAVFGGAFDGFPAGANLLVSGSAISNAGLSTSANTTAVINTNQPNATSVVIVNNQYKGNATNVEYFIDAHQAAPISQVAGNKTNTLLPTKVGP